jgi:hypothetical protein
MAKVYIVNNGGHDYSGAEVFGDLVFCSRGTFDRTDTAMMFRELSTSLEQAEIGDYLLLTSLCTLCSIATGILVDRFGKVNFLLYEAGHYTVRTVMFDSWYTGD